MKNIFLLGLTSLFTDISSEMVYPLVGIYLTTLNTPYYLIGIVEGIAESLSNLLKVFSGNVSDKFKKRKPFVVVGYFSSLIGKFLLYISNSWSLVLLSRVVDRFGKGVRTAPRDALIAESVHEEKKGRVFGFHRAMDTFGAICGVIIVYIFISSVINDVVVLKKTFLFSCIPAAIGVIILFFVKDTVQLVNKDIAQTKISFANFKIFPSKVNKYILISTIFALGNSSNQFLLLKSKTVGFKTATIILLYLVYNISYAIISYPAGVISDKIGKKRVILLGYLVYSIVYFFFGMLNEETKNFVWILFIIYGIYIGLVEGQEKAFLSEVAPEEYKASVLGVHYTITGLMLFPASFIAGMLWDKIGHSAPFVFGSIISFFSFLLMIFLLK